MIGRIGRPLKMYWKSFPHQGYEHKKKKKLGWKIAALVGTLWFCAQSQFRFRFVYSGARRGVTVVSRWFWERVLLHRAELTLYRLCKVLIILGENTKRGEEFVSLVFTNPVKGCKGQRRGLIWVVSHSNTLTPYFLWSISCSWLCVLTQCKKNNGSFSFWKLYSVVKKKDKICE